MVISVKDLYLEYLNEQVASIEKSIKEQENSPLRYDEFSNNLALERIAEYKTVLRCVNQLRDKYIEIKEKSDGSYFDKEIERIKKERAEYLGAYERF